MATNISRMLQSEIDGGGGGAKKTPDGAESGIAAGISAAAAKKDIAGDIKRITDKYSAGITDFRLPESQGLQRMEYDPKSDGDIAALAASRLADYYLSSVNAIGGDAERNAANLESQKDGLKSAAEDKQKILEDLYAAAVESVNNDTLRRGIARSSIANNQIAGIEQKKAEGLYNIGKDYTDGIYRLSAELDALEAKKQKALADFDISYAAKLAMEISDLTLERDRKVNEALKYNNDIAEKEAKYESDKKQNEQKIQKSGYELFDTANDASRIFQAKNAQNAEIFNYLNDYLMSLSKEEALSELLNNPDVRANTDYATFNKLYEQIKLR